MKKIIPFAFLLISLSSSAQLVSGIGLMGGITYAKQKWKVPEPLSAQFDSERKYKLGLNGCLFVEWFHHRTFRMVTELQYNQKGTKEVMPDGSKFKNKTDYFSFNNFLKVRFETFSGYPYFLIGPRVEYLFRKNAQVYPEIINDFKTLHFSWSAGVGFEFISYGPIKFLTELHYNPDLNRAYDKNDIKIKNTAFELRVGIRYSFTREQDRCP